MKKDWDFIDDWLKAGDDRKVIIHRLKDKLHVELYWRGSCVMRSINLLVLEEPKPKPKPKLKKRK